MVLMSRARRQASLVNDPVMQPKNNFAPRLRFYHQHAYSQIMSDEEMLGGACELILRADAEGGEVTRNDGKNGDVPFLVAGVGASAGGLEAFGQVLGHIPAATHMALILVQHLSRDHASVLPALLAARTALIVEDGIDGRRIEAGHVYVIRPNTHMMVVDGHLRVQPRPEGRGQDAPVDHLFESMAEQYRERALGVVLSGGGSDGAWGLQRIRAVGGITMAQDPLEAQVDGMPRSAIGSGAVDVVLSTERIAAELVRLAAHPFFDDQASPTGSQFDLVEDSHFQNILTVLRRASGVDFSRYKTPTIRRRMRRRMAFHRLTDLPAYLSLLQQSSDEAKLLHDDILIHVTSFFRDPESFEALKLTVLPKIIAENRGNAPIRMWVPGCSSGEEVYSIAITLIEALEQAGENVPITVFGTDLSQRMVEQARAGVYPAGIASDVSPAQLQRFFLKVEGGYRVSAEVRERCVFARQDITRDPPFSKLDLIMCRNLLIYLGQPAQRRLIGLFHYALLPHGALVLGRSETVGPLPELFAISDARWKIYERQAGSSRPHADFGYQTSQQSALPQDHGRALVRERPARDLQNETNRALLERYAPPLLVIDEALRIVRASGRTSAFLELPSGDATLDVLRLVRPSLMAPLRAAIQEVRLQGGHARREGIELLSDDQTRTVDIEVSKVGGNEQHLIVVFEEARRSRELTAIRNEASVSHDTALEQLHRALTDTRADLQSMIQELEGANEQLQSANEEILSSNEELQSTNEELDTAREELQSTNEELGTVNEELQTRNRELSNANGDLINLLGSVEIPIVIVDAGLRIRRFTPAAERALNLIPADAGRPIGHIKPNIGFPELEAVMNEVIAQGVIRERQVQDQEGRTLLATVRPYKNVANRIDGAVLALVDVSAPLKLAREVGEAVIASVRDPILLLDSKLIIQRANEAFFKAFATTSEATEGRSVLDLQGSQWNTPQLRQLFQEILPLKRNFQNVEVDYEPPGEAPRRLLLDGRRVESGRGDDAIIFLTIRSSEDGL